MPVRFVLCVVLTFGSLFHWAQAAERDRSSEAQIEAVERGLVPTVRVRNRTTPITIAERMKRDGVPGVSIAVIDDFQVVWSKGYGLVTSMESTPVTAETQFQAASMSKPVTALATLRLVEQKTLDLDSDVNRWLKSWQVPENDFTRQHAVDLRGLLSHTAGMTVHGFAGYAVGAKLPSLVEILDGQKPANSAPVRVDKVPGNGFRYAGGGTTIVQQLLIDVTGRPFDEWMAETVLRPLAMDHSAFEQPPLAEHERQAATAHDGRGRPIAGRWNVYPELAAAGLWTTAADMARYVVEVQLARDGRSQRIIGEATTRDMLTPQNGGPVGLGPFLLEHGSQKYFGHGGQNLGFSCEMLGSLERGQGVVVLTNSDAGHHTVREIINSVALAYDWPDFLPAERDAIDVDAATRDRLAGDYALSPVAVANILHEEGRLRIKLPRQPAMELHLASADEFFTEDPDLTGEFNADDQGAITGIDLRLGERTVHGKRRQP